MHKHWEIGSDMDNEGVRYLTVWLGDLTLYGALRTFAGREGLYITDHLTERDHEYKLLCPRQDIEGEQKRLEQHFASFYASRS